MPKTLIPEDEKFFEPGTPEHAVFKWHTDYGISTKDLCIILKSDIRVIREVLKRERDIRGEMLERFEKWAPAVAYAIELDLLPMSPRTKSLNIILLCSQIPRAAAV